MRRTLLLLVVGLIQTMLFAETAWAQGTGFFDDFTYFDATRWSVGDHRLGRSYLDPANVSVDGGNLRIKLPARTLEGGEILTNDLYAYGSYSARIKLPHAPGSITGFFLYKSPNYESEIDIEVFNDSTRRIMFTTYSGGRRTHTKTALLPFDPTARFHQYRFDYAPDAITFFVDGQPMKTWYHGIPQSSMHLMLNTWFPAWLDGKRPKRTTYTYVDWIQHTQSSESGIPAS